MKKKVISLFLVMCMLCTFFSVASAYEVNSGNCGRNLTWSLSDDGILTIYGKGEMNFFDSNDSPWRSDGSIVSVIITDGATSIEWGAFSKCSKLTSVTIPDSVKEIEQEAFSDCGALTNITIPDGVTKIAKEAFSGSGLTSITIGSGLTDIDMQSFNGCNDLNDIFVSDKNPNYSSADGILYNKDKSTLINCFRKNVTDVVVPEEVKTIKSFAFSDCYDLANITIPAGVTSIGESAFYNTDWYSKQADGIVYAGNVLYKYKGKMVSGSNIVIKDGTKGIADNAFDDCDNDPASVTIPDGIENIGDHAFDGCHALTNIKLPDSVTNIGIDAFYDCSAIKEINISDKVTYIGACAFSGCSGLTDIKIPDGIKSIEDYTFCNCSKLTNITIPGSVTSIGESAFDGCSSLTSIAIPDKVTNIGNKAFINCDALTEIYWNAENVADFNADIEMMPPDLKKIFIGNTAKRIPAYAFCNCTAESVVMADSVTSIGNHAFAKCNRLTSIKISDGMTDIEKSAFYSCSALTDVTLPDSVKNIGRYAFAWCINLKNITIPNGVTSIGKHAFSYCSALAEIKIPGSVTDINENAFSESCNLTNITVDSSSSSYSSSDGILYNKDKTILVCCPSGIQGKFVVPDGVKTIGKTAFYDCENLTSVTLPDSVTSIEDSAFCYCGILTEIVMGTGIKHIGESVFLSCDSLTNITLPNGITDIEDDAFAACSALKNITLPDSLININKYIFSESEFESIKIGSNTKCIDANTFNSCAYLTDISVSDENPDYSSSDGVLYNKDKSSLIYCPPEKTGDLVIPDSVTSIGDQAFYCSKLTNITFPDSVAEIGSEAFYESTWYENQPDGIVYAGSVLYKYKGTMPAKTDIVVKDGTKSISNEAFYDCDELTSLTLPGSMVSIDDGAFTQCGLKSITIPENVTNIGKTAFLESSIKNITVDDKNGSYVSDNNILYNKDKSTLIYCGNGEAGDFIVPDTVTSIGDFAFANRSGLTSVTIPGSVTSIGKDAFSGCLGLLKVIMSDGVKSIGKNAFSSCEKVSTIVIPDSVTDIGKEAFACCSGLKSLKIGSGIKSIPDVTVKGSEETSSIRSTLAEADSNYSNSSDISTEDAGSSSGGGFGNTHNYDDEYDTEEQPILGHGVFEGCVGLTEVTIPAGVTSIGSYAFNGCERLRDVYYGGSEEQWKNIRISIKNEMLTSSGIHYNTDYARPDIEIGEPEASGNKVHAYLDNKTGKEITFNIAVATYDKDGKFKGVKICKTPLSKGENDVEITMDELSDTITVMCLDNEFRPLLETAKNRVYN